MGREQPLGRMSIDQYLAWEEKSPFKHEYVCGEVFRMQGCTTRHNLIMLNIASALRPLSRRRGCRVYATDVKLRAGADRIYYPDIILACGAAASVELIVEAPSFVVEVASRSTRTTDRREKLDAYMRLPSLAVYLIVEQNRRYALAYVRDEALGWVRHELSGQGSVPLDFLGGAISLDEIYDDVPLPPLSVKEQEAEWPDWDEDEDEPEDDA